MGTVEDGEILELDKDEVIDLCSDGARSPPPIHESNLNVPLAQVNDAPPPVPLNTYTGGDPMLGPQPQRSTLRNPNVAFARPHLCRSSPQYDHGRGAGAVLSDMHSHLHPPVPPEQRMFRRDPYATNNLARSSIQEHVSEAANIPMQPLSFPLSTPHHPFTNPRVPSVPALAPSHEIPWPRATAADCAAEGFGRPCGPRILNPQDFDRNQGRYSLKGEQLPFADGLVYHAEPAPPPSPYGMQHPPVRPMNADPRRIAFDRPRRRRVQAGHQMQGRSRAMLNHEVYDESIAVNEHLHPLVGVANPSDGYANVAVPYQRIHEVQCLQVRGHEGEVDEEVHVQRGGQVPALGIDESAKDPRFFFQRHLSGTHERHLSQVVVTKQIRNDEGRGKRRRVNTGQGSFSDEEDRNANLCDDRDSQSAKCDELDLCQAPEKEEKRRWGSSLSHDGASEGEIHSSRSASPVMSLATAPDETPSPPSSTKKKLPNCDAKRNLSELRRKALLSVKKRPAIPRKVESLEPSSPGVNPSPVASAKLEAEETKQNVQTEAHLKMAAGDGCVAASKDRPSNPSPELAPGFGISMDSMVQLVVGGVLRTMTRKEFAEWQTWPYRNRVLVEYSSDSSDGGGSDSEHDDDDIMQEVSRSPLRNREREIEAMKIRMVRLGRCPSILYGSSGFKNRTFSGSERKPEDDKQVATTSCKDAVENSAQAPAQNEVPVTVRHASQRQQNSSTEQISSPNAEQELEATASSADTDAVLQKPPSAEGNRNETPVEPISGPKSPALSFAKHRSSVELFESSGQALSNASGISKTTSAKDSETCAQVKNGQDNCIGKESPTEVKAVQSATCAPAENPIAELKRRIEAIEKSRDMLKQQQHKKQKTTSHHMTTANSKRNPKVEQKRSQHDANVPLESKSDKTERSIVQGDKRAMQRRFNGLAKRYYASGTSGTMNQGSTEQHVDDRREEDMDTETKLQGSTPDATEKMTAWKEKQDLIKTLQFPGDTTERGYIHDLKLELEQKTKELNDERDRAEQLRTAEVAIAEAQAKLNFTRSRVSGLREELRKAEREVLDAEKEYQQRARVVAQLRFASDDSSGCMTSRQEDQTCGPQVSAGRGIDVPNTQSAKTTEEDCEEGMRQEEGGDLNDFILRPSPYSPSVGDNFTSCLRGLRAYASVIQVMSFDRWDTNSYLLRIPNHSVAMDRMSGSLLSATWRVDLDPMKAVCPQEARGQCSNKACEYQHLKLFKAPKDQALQVIEVLECFFSREDKKKAEKSIINARIAIHEGKDATKTISSLISTLCASSKALPYSCAAN